MRFVSRGYGTMWVRHAYVSCRLASVQGIQSFRAAMLCCPSPRDCVDVFSLVCVCFVVIPSDRPSNSSNSGRWEMRWLNHTTAQARPRVTAAGISRIFYGPPVAPSPWRLGQAREVPVGLRWGYPRLSREAGGGGRGKRWMEFVVNEMELCVAGQTWGDLGEPALLPHQELLAGGQRATRAEFQRT